MPGLPLQNLGARAGVWVPSLQGPYPCPHRLLRPLCPPVLPCRGPDVCKLWQCLLSPPFQGREESRPFPDQEPGPHCPCVAEVPPALESVLLTAVVSVTCLTAFSVRRRAPCHPLPPLLHPQCRALCTQGFEEHSFCCEQDCLPPTFHPRMRSQQGVGELPFPKPFSNWPP